MKKLLSYYAQGLLVVIPIAATAFVIFWLVSLVDKHLTIRTENYTIRGGGLVLILIILPIVGYFAKNFLGRKLLETFDNFINKIPIIKLLYAALKDLMQAFTGDQPSFRKPVIVDVAGNGTVYIPGFITRESADFLEMEDHVVVFFPQSYNVAGGNVFVFPSKNVKLIKTDPAEVMAFIVSAGVSGPKGKVVVDSNEQKDQNDFNGN